MSPLTYFKKDLGFSFREGGSGFNFTVLFPWAHAGFFFYVYILGFRVYWPK